MNHQTPWSVANVIGHTKDPYTNKFDPTEGFGAFDSIAKFYSIGARTIDIGGGEHDFNSAYCLHKYDAEQMVYDPFMRSGAHNKKVLEIAAERPFQSCTSISVLNVIDTKEARIEHIKLCRLVIRDCGKVFFKVWPGNGSGISEKKEDSFQSNRGLESYLEEIASVFGKRNVMIDMANKTIVCRKMEPL